MWVIMYWIVSCVWVSRSSAFVSKSGQMHYARSCHSEGRAAESKDLLRCDTKQRIFSAWVLRCTSFAQDDRGSCVCSAIKLIEADNHNGYYAREYFKDL